MQIDYPSPLSPPVLFHAQTKCHSATLSYPPQILHSHLYDRSAVYLLSNTSPSIPFHYSSSPLPSSAYSCITPHLPSPKPLSLNHSSSRPIILAACSCDTYTTSLSLRLLFSSLRRCHRDFFFFPSVCLLADEVNCERDVAAYALSLGPHGAKGEVDEGEEEKCMDGFGGSEAWR